MERAVTAVVCDRCQLVVLRVKEVALSEACINRMMAEGLATWVQSQLRQEQLLRILREAGVESLTVFESMAMGQLERAAEFVLLHAHLYEPQHRYLLDIDALRAATTRDGPPRTL